MRVEVGWVTATGLRADNQDCVLVAGMLSAGDAAQEASFDVDADHPLLVAVFDGLGGHAGGGVASRVAAGVLGGARVPRDDDELTALVRLASRTVSNYSKTIPRTRGMATTVVGFVLDGSSCRVFHAGDSLAFRLADGALGRLTDPHVEPDPWRPGATLITRCLGMGADPGLEIRMLALEGPLRLLASSDGVSEVLSADALRAPLASGTAADAARSLVAAATRAGSQDNMTALVVNVPV